MFTHVRCRGEARRRDSLATVSLDDTDLFGAAASAGDGVGGGGSSLPPLAVRMRPRSIDEVRGQGDVLRPGSPLRRLIEGSGGAAGPISAILWGPPGTGKTTLAHLVATAADREFVELSAVTAGVKDVRAVMEHANRARDMYGRQTVLFLDEIHRFTKAQQDALLPGVENRQVVLVAATTENPSFSVIAPLLSRSMLVTLVPLTDDDVADVLDSARDRRARPRRGVHARRRRPRPPRAAGRRRRPPGADLPRGRGRGRRRRRRPRGRPAGCRADHPRAERAGRRPRRRALRPHRRPALRRGLGADQVDARLRRRRRPALPRPDARGGGGPALHRPADRHRGLRGRRPGRPHRAADRGRGDARGGPDRHARGADHPGPGGRAQRARAEVERRLHRHQRGDRRRAGRQGRAGAAPTCAAAATPGAARLGHGKGYVYAHDEPDAVAAQQYLPDDLAGSTDYYRPTDRGFEARLQERWTWLKGRLGRG